MFNANMKATAILSAEDRASQVLAMVARNFDRLNKAAEIKVKGAEGINRVNAALDKRNRMLRDMATIGAATGQNLGFGLGGMAGAMAVGGLIGAIGAVTAAAVLSTKAFATNERAMTRIGVTAEATRQEQDLAAIAVQNVADQTALAPDKVREGLDTLVAAGRTLKDSMAFLPAVAKAAQASGAQLTDMASTADAVGASLKVNAADMGAAFDSMVTAGKLGKFELEDMARYLPELAPLAKTAGLEGVDGLNKLVSALQMTRKEAGTSEEAATNLKNVFSKMFTQETEKKFKKMGVDLPKVFEKAKKNGDDLLETFVKVTMEATKGDMTKLPKLFEDMQAQSGMRALMNNLAEWQRMRGQIKASSSGAVDRDLARVLQDVQTSFDRAGASASRFAQNMGEITAPVVAGTLDRITQLLQQVNAAMERNKVLTQQMKEAGVKKLAEPETRKQYETRLKAERLLRESDPAYLEEINNMTDGGFHRRAPTLPPRGTLARIEYDHQRALEARDALKKKEKYDLDVQRRHFRASESQLYEDQKNNTGTYGKTMDEVLANKQPLRKLGYSKGGLGETAALANAEIVSLIQEIKDIEQSGLQNRPGQMQERYKGLKQSLRKKVEEADYNQAKENQTFKSSPEELDSKVKTLLEGAKVEVKPDQITAKVEGNVTTETVVRVEPSENFITTVISRVIAATGNAFGSAPPSAGAVNP